MKTLELRIETCPLAAANARSFSVRAAAASGRRVVYSVGNRDT